MKRPIKELCLWRFPVWIVQKTETNGLQMVGDFRLLNKRTITDEVGISDIKETIELSGSQCFKSFQLNRKHF